MSLDATFGHLETEQTRIVARTSETAFERLQNVWRIATTRHVKNHVVLVLVTEVEAGERDVFLLQQYGIEAGVNAHLEALKRVNEETATVLRLMMLYTAQ